MPIYEYRCESCGAQMEKIQKFSDPLLTQCPECKKESLVKLVSAGGFRLKGTGWYETDFKTSGTKRNLAGGSTTESTVNTGGKESSKEGSKDSKTGAGSSDTAPKKDSGTSSSSSAA